MGNKKIIGIQTDNKQPIKKISYQDIYVLYDLLEQLDSWNETLCMLVDFFKDEQRPLNKNKIIKKYYSNSKLFSVFYEEYEKIINRMRKQIKELKVKEKV